MAVQIDNDETKPFSGNMALDLDESAKNHTKAKHLRRRVKRIRSRRANHGHAVLPLRRRARGVQGVAREHLSFARVEWGERVVNIRVAVGCY